MAKDKNRKTIPAIRIEQWMQEWEEIPDSQEMERHFYAFSMNVLDLKRLSAVHQRSTQGRESASQDDNIQRRLDIGRSKKIAQYVRYGYPMDTVTKTAQEKEDISLRNPGWLPAIIVNIVKSEDTRILRKDAVKIEDNGNSRFEIKLPNGFNKNWEPTALHPIEVIDGQHRLAAFEETTEEGKYEKYELPVIAFHGLSRAKQAYLFYTINIRPKKINTSLAYDLYPLLRQATWLESGPDAHKVQAYREIRAREIIDLLWGHPKSPWQHRINMLGESLGQEAGTQVSQAAWVRSLYSTFMKKSTSKIGGLYYAKNLNSDNENNDPWAWPISQQVALLITMGNMLRHHLNNSESFNSKFCLLNQDVGMRGLLNLWNDMLFTWASESSNNAKQLHDAFKLPPPTGQQEEPSEAHNELHKKIDMCLQKSMVRDPTDENSALDFMDNLSKHLSSYNWNTFKHEAVQQLPADSITRIQKQALRGSAGYKIIREGLIKHIQDQGSNTEISNIASIISEKHGIQP